MARVGLENQAKILDTEETQDPVHLAEVTIEDEAENDRGGDSRNQIGDDGDPTQEAQFPGSPTQSEGEDEPERDANHQDPDHEDKRPPDRPHEVRILEEIDVLPKTDELRCAADDLSIEQTAKHRVKHGDEEEGSDHQDRWPGRGGRGRPGCDRPDWTDPGWLLTAADFSDPAVFRRRSPLVGATRCQPCSRISSKGNAAILQNPSQTVAGA